MSFNILFRYVLGVGWRSSRMCSLGWTCNHQSKSNSKGTITKEQSFFLKKYYDCLIRIGSGLSIILVIMALRLKTQNLYFSLSLSLSLSLLINKAQDQQSVKIYWPAKKFTCPHISICVTFKIDYKLFQTFGF